MELSKEVTQDSKNIALLIIDRDCISGPVNFSVIGTMGWAGEGKIAWQCQGVGRG